MAGPVAFPETDDARIWIVERERGKAYVRAGGELPGVVHDPHTGEVFLGFTARNESGAEVLLRGDEQPSPVRLDRLSFSVDGENPVSSLEALLSTFGETDDATEGHLAAAIAHLVAGQTLAESVRPADAQWRWFNDGFATAIAEETLRRIGRTADAQASVTLRDPERFGDLRGSLALGHARNVADPIGASSHWILVRLPIWPKRRIPSRSLRSMKLRVAWRVRGHALPAWFI